MWMWPWPICFSVKSKIQNSPTERPPSQYSTASVTKLLIRSNLNLSWNNLSPSVPSSASAEQPECRLQGVGGALLRWNRHTDLKIKVCCFSRLSRWLPFEIAHGLYCHSCRLRKKLNRSIKGNQQCFKRFHFYLMLVLICREAGGGLLLDRVSGNT